jgi:Fe-S cluster biogenesis protein NfuA
LRNADCGSRNERLGQNQDTEQIKAIIASLSRRYLAKGGDVQLAGIEDGTVKIAPAGYCWQ